MPRRLRDSRGAGGRIGNEVCGGRRIWRSEPCLREFWDRGNARRRTGWRRVSFRKS
jgi:hypothetical protein